MEGAKPSGRSAARGTGPKRKEPSRRAALRPGFQACEAITSEVSLRKAPDRRGFFVCNLSVAWPDGRTASFEGRLEGTLVWPIRGARGFGFDPMFQPRGHDVTFGEMDRAAKEAMSHRALAFAKLSEALLRPA